MTLYRYNQHSSDLCLKLSFPDRQRWTQVKAACRDGMFWGGVDSSCWCIGWNSKGKRRTKGDLQSSGLSFKSKWWCHSQRKNIFWEANSETTLKAMGIHWRQIDSWQEQEQSRGLRRGFNVFGQRLMWFWWETLSTLTHVMTGWREGKRSMTCLVR